MSTPIDLHITWDDDTADLGAVARALTEIVAEQEGVSRVKGYINGNLVAESSILHEDECCECGSSSHDCNSCPVTMAMWRS